MHEPYAPVESWLYDRIVADAATRLLSSLEGYLPASLPADARVLDVGCGGGQNAMYLAERYPVSQITGLDLSAEQIARAERRARTRGIASTWLVGDATAMARAGVGDSSFDMVYSIASIKHWPEPGKGIAEMVRVARPGARVVIAEADRACRLDDASAFVRLVGLPRLFHPIALAAFRTWVAGRSLTVHEARALWADVPVREATVETIPGMPVFVMSAIAT